MRWPWNFPHCSRLKFYCNNYFEPKCQDIKQMLWCVPTEFFPTLGIKYVALNIYFIPEFNKGRTHAATGQRVVLKLELLKFELTTFDYEKRTNKNINNLTGADDGDISGATSLFSNALSRKKGELGLRSNIITFMKTFLYKYFAFCPDQHGR